MTQHRERRYRIRVDDRLNPEFAPGIDGLAQSDDAADTTLAGELFDQSQLHGILDRLRRLGVDILRSEIYGPGALDP